MTLHSISGMAVEDEGEGDAVVCLHGLGGTSNTWTPLMPALGVAEIMDVTPWGGWEITHAGESSLGPVLVPGGRAVVESSKGLMTVRLNGRAVLRTNLPGRFRRIVLGDRSSACRSPLLRTGRMAGGGSSSPPMPACGCWRRGSARARWR